MAHFGHRESGTRIILGRGPRCQIFQDSMEHWMDHSIEPGSGSALVEARSTVTCRPCEYASIQACISAYTRSTRWQLALVGALIELMALIGVLI